MEFIGICFYAWNSLEYSIESKYDSDYSEFCSPFKNIDYTIVAKYHQKSLESTVT